LVKPPYGVLTAIDLNTATIKFKVPHGDTPDAVRATFERLGINYPEKTGQAGSVGLMVTKTLVVVGDPQVTAPPGRQRGAMLRAYDKQTGKEVGAVWLPAPQSGSPMTYMANGKQYIIVAVSGGNYTGEYIAFALPDSAVRTTSPAHRNATDRLQRGAIIHTRAFCASDGPGTASHDRTLPSRRPHRPRRNGCRLQGEGPTHRPAGGDQAPEHARRIAQGSVHPGSAVGRQPRPPQHRHDFDFGEHEGQSYIVMEYVEGVTLAEQIHDSVPIPMWRKLEIIEELASGLDYAHNKGIVHRDVKPANVMTDREGVVKILDFGIARVGNITMTQAGMMLGTPNYMSPEQFESGRVDRRSDIFSVGVLLYELLAYRKAFTGEQVWDVMKAVMTKTPPPLTDFVPGIDSAIEAAVARAIEKDPAKRYQTLAEMSADLAKARARLGVRLAGRDSDTVLTPPQEQAPRTPRPSTDRELISRRRAERIDAYLKEAQAAFDAGEFGTAVEACDQALLLDPDDGRLHALIEQARRALDHQQAVEVLADARSAFERSDLERAAALVDQAIQLDASFHDAGAFKSVVDGRIRQRDAEHKRRQQELAAAQQMVEEQKRQFAAGHWHEALGALERYTPRHEIIAAAIADLRSELAELDRRAREEEEQQKREQAEAQRRWVARQFDLAKRAMTNQQFVEAIEILEHVKRNSSNAPGLTDLLKQAVQGKSAAEEAIRRKEEIAQILRRAAAEVGLGKLLEARSLVASALSIDPAHPEALDKLREIKNAIDAEERQKQEAARQREAERLRREQEEAAAAEARAKKEQEIAAAALRAQRERDAAAAEARAKQEREAAAAKAAAAAEAEARVKREKEAAAAAEARARKEQEAAAAARAKQEREAAAAAEARAKKERKAAAAAEARAKKEQQAAAAAQAKQDREAATKRAQAPAVAAPSQPPSGKSTTISPPVALYTPGEAVQPQTETPVQLTAQATKLPPKILAAAGGGLVLLLAIVYFAFSGGSTPDRIRRRPRRRRQPPRRRRHPRLRRPHHRWLRHRHRPPLLRRRQRHRPNRNSWRSVLVRASSSGGAIGRPESPPRTKASASARTIPSCRRS
jgi:hypothetical protein